MSKNTDTSKFDTSIAFTSASGSHYLIGISQRSNVLHYTANPSNQIKATEHPRNFQRIWTVCGQVAFNADVYGSGWYDAEEEARFDDDDFEDYQGTICKSCIRRESK